MKVLMLGWEYPPHISGGLGTACYGLNQGLAQNDVEIAFVLPRVHGDEADGAERLLGCEQVDLEAHPPTVSVIGVDSVLTPYLTEAEYQARCADVPRFTGNYGHDLMAEVSRYARAVARISADESCDVVHGHDWMTFPAAAAAARIAHKPLVLHVHSCEHDRAGDNADTRITEIEQQGLDAADRVICVSRYTAEQLQTHYRTDAAKLCVVHNAPPDGTTVRRGEEPVRIEEPIVLFLGRVTFQKGPEYFLEAAARVVREEPRVKFVVAGSGDLLPGMIERAAELGLARSVHFTGFLRGEDVERMYEEASVYVLPSVSEPFGITPLEAMARDVPVIVSRQSGVSEVVENALKVDFWNVEELANKILAVLRRPALGRQLAEGGRAELRELSWERQAALIRSIYEELVA